MTVPPKKPRSERVNPAELLQAQLIQREQRRIEWADRRKRGRQRAQEMSQERLDFDHPAWAYVQKRINADRDNGYKVNEPWCYRGRLKLHLARWHDITDVAGAGGNVVYYAKVSKYIKIGTTQDIDQRMRSYPPDSKVLITEPGSYALEEERHQQFAEYLAAGNEWFKPNPVLAAHIKNLQRIAVEQLRAARRGA